MTKRKVALITYNRIDNCNIDYGTIETEDADIFINQASAGLNILNFDRLKDMDQTYLYVGVKHNEYLIQKTKDIPSDKITYVMCDCENDQKQRLIGKYRDIGTKTRGCECGGHKTMARIFKDESGETRKSIEELRWQRKMRDPVERERIAMDISQWLNGRTL